MSRRFSVLALVLDTVLLSVCCGLAHAGDVTIPGARIKVIGASLEDSGTFGFKFTVQSASGKPYKTYVEQIAASRGLPDLCNHYTVNAATGAPSGPLRPACTNYAVAGAQIHNYVSASGVVDDSTASSVMRQMADMGAAGFRRNELVIVGEAVGNDVEALLTAAGSADATGPASFAAYVDSLLGAQAFESAMAKLAVIDGGDPRLGMVAVGVRFMAALADKLMTAVRVDLIHNGAQRVVILNALDVLKTPVFQYTLSTLSASDQASTRALAQTWLLAYNTELRLKAAQFGGKVVVFDLYTSFNHQYAHPQRYGVTNIDSTVCTQTYQRSINGVASLATAGTDALDTPEVRRSCNDQTASSITPTENATGAQWWTTYLFADDFHPTPYGHQLLAQSLTKKLDQVGWH